MLCFVPCDFDCVDCKQFSLVDLCCTCCKSLGGYRLQSFEAPPSWPAHQLWSPAHRMRSLVGMPNDGLIVLNPSGRNFYCNGSFNGGGSKFPFLNWFFLEVMKVIISLYRFSLQFSTSHKFHVIGSVLGLSPLVLCQYSLCPWRSVFLRALNPFTAKCDKKQIRQKSQENTSKEISFEWSNYSSGGSRGGGRGGAPLIVRPNRGSKGRKNFSWRPDPPYLRVWMTSPPLPPPPSYLKVWIRRSQT